MGKRKRRSDNNKTPPPSDFIPHAPQVDLQLERGPHQAESSARHSLPSVLKTPPSDQSHLNQNRTMLLRHPRHSFGRQYSRRSSTNHSDPSPSHWNGTPVYDGMLSYKLANKDLPEFPYRERWDRTFHKPERIRSSSLALNAVSSNVRDMECGICQKRLRKNPSINLENSMISPNDHSVVAILVCGHAYHADCLEQKTNHEDRQDPPCPFCPSAIS
ncbi:hypothetical protein BUALT_Bualt16G0075200 [Buddleja alternifolia]|uniref:RING-type domain-containing protein n=1 Tax=Buddleja alternifolia TaxID=168488 RepID=A0AAV6W9U3_9LAMI|nr:hypothetical protein BUALT_Bualt16G0075200 [Buddleja alternifolia]